MRFASEGWPFVLPFVGLAALFFLMGRMTWGWVVLVTGFAVLLFFRDPTRRFDGDPGVVLAAADGLITAVDEIEDSAVGPGRFQRVVTFLSVFDVHVQRIPRSGRVVTSLYTPGRKVAAFRKVAGEVNENHLVVIENPSGDRIGVRQIAGLLARRVVAYPEVDDLVERGQHLGLIKFGSRVDVLLPPGYQILVEKGQRLKNGQTPLARPPERP